MRYSWPAIYETPRPEIAIALREWRREYVNLRTEMLGFAKEFQPDNRFFKERAAEYLRFERACTLMLPWFECQGKPIQPSNWPLEMEFELDMISGAIYLLP